MDLNKITLTEFAQKNGILINKDLQEEMGYNKFSDGSYLVSMTCPMPNITSEMIQWWFWWHPQKDERYQMWFPGEHFAISYAKKDKHYFEQEKLPEFQNNTQYPVERIGNMKMPLRIDFVEPKEFGFSEKDMLANDIPLIVCGHVGAYKGLIWHTEMAHIFKQTEDETAKGMAEHCYTEYRNLVKILPELYLRENE